VRRLIADYQGEPIVIQCDKHGGRNRYAALLQPVFPEVWVKVVRESCTASVYRSP